LLAQDPALRLSASSSSGVFSWVSVRKTRVIDFF
jgi:hypothetical protein